MMELQHDTCEVVVLIYCMYFLFMCPTVPTYFFSSGPYQNSQRLIYFDTAFSSIPGSSHSVLKMVVT